MGLAKTHRETLRIGDRPFVWGVSEGNNGSSWGPILHAESPDKRFAILYLIEQPDPPFLVVLGREFPGLPDPDGSWVRVRCPRFDDGRSASPGSVRQLIDWCLDPAKTIVRVDYRGKALE